MTQWHKRVGDRSGRLVARLAIACGVVFLLAPVCVTVSMAFDRRSFLGAFPPPGLSLRWFTSFFGNSYYVTGLRTSVIVAAIAATLATLIGGSAAIFVDRRRTTGAAAIAAVLMTPMTVPAVVLGFALFIFLAHLPFYSALGFIIAGHTLITFPLVMRATMASLAGIDPSLAEAALTLGARDSQVLTEITLPLARAGIVSGWFFAAAFSLDDVGIALFLSSATTYTLPVAFLGSIRSSFDLSIAAGGTILIMGTAALVVGLHRTVGLERVIGTGAHGRA